MYALGPFPGNDPIPGQFSRELSINIPLFNYTPLQMTINGVQGGGGYREYVLRGGHLNAGPRVLEDIMEACQGGGGGGGESGTWNNIEACQGGHLQICPWAEGVES